MEEPFENSGHLSGKFDDFEFTPPEPVWDRVQGDLAKGPGAGFLAGTLGEMTHAPRAAVWRKVARQINPAYARRRAFVWWSSAAGVALLLGWSILTNLGGALSGSESGSASGLAGTTVLPADSNPLLSPDRNLAGATVGDSAGAGAGPAPVLAKDLVDRNGSTPTPTPGGNISPTPFPNHSPIANQAPVASGNLASDDGGVPELRERTLPENILTARSVEFWAAAGLPVRPEAAETAPPLVLTEIPRFPGDGPASEASENRYGVLLASSVQGSGSSMLNSGIQNAFEASNDLNSSPWPATDPDRAPDDVKYTPPFVVGGKFRFQLSRRWASDFGLNYTLIRSNRTQEYSQRVVGTQMTWQYFGPSAEMVYNLRPDRKVNFFLSGGLKLDFGLSVRVNEEVTEDGFLVDQGTDTFKPGRQTSALTGLGVDVQVAPQWSLFAQGNANIGLHEVLPNAWSQQVFWPSAQVGLRFDFR